MVVTPQGTQLKQGYKPTDVGAIPEDWEIDTLGNCLLGTPQYGINAPAVQYSDSLPTYLRITDITDDGRFSPDNIASVRQAGADKYAMKLGDLVFARTGASVGKSYLYRPEDGELVFAGYLIRVRANPAKLLPEYLAYYVKTDRYWSWVQAMSMRSGQPGINGNEYAQLPIPLPPPPEQHAIVGRLGDIDVLLIALDQLIAKKRSIKQGALQRLLTGQTRLPGFREEPDSGYAKTEVGKIPADWEVRTVAEIAEVKGGKRLPAGAKLSSSPTPYPYIRIVDMVAGSVSMANMQYVPVDVFPSIKNYRIFKDDIFITVAGTLGIVGHVPPALSGANLTENADKITNITCDEGYLFHVLMSPRIQRTLESEKTVGAQPKLALGRIKTFQVPLPANRREQQAIAAVLSDMDAEIAGLEQRREKTQAVKQGMMQELLTGRRRLV